MVFILCILLSINLANTTYLLNKKYTILALIGPIIGCIFPYFKDTGNLLSNIHEICAYISFGIVMFINLSNINRYKVYNYKRGILIERLFIIIFILDGLIYLKLLGVTSIQETILLSTILIIQEYLYSQILKK